MSSRNSTSTVCSCGKWSFCDWNLIDPIRRGEGLVLVETVATLCSSMDLPDEVELLPGTTKGLPLWS